MDIISITRQHISESVRVKEALLHDPKAIETISQIALVCTEAYQRGNKVIWAGNSIALTTDTSIITAIGNDYGYEMVFSRQLQANAVKGDVFIGISTSGNSRNLVTSIDICRQRGVTTVALVGSQPCDMDTWDYVVKIPSRSTPRIQECQTLIGHIICCIVEENLFGKKGNEP